MYDEHCEARKRDLDNLLWSTRATSGIQPHDKPICAHVRPKLRSAVEAFGGTHPLELRPSYRRSPDDRQEWGRWFV